MRPRGRVAAASLLLLAVACGGGGDDAADDEPSSGPGSASAVEETTTTEAEDEPLELPTSYRVEGTVDYDGFPTDVRGIVADAEHYALTFDDAGFHAEVVRVGGRVFDRAGSSADTAAARPFQQAPDEVATALGFLLGDAELGPPPQEAPGFERTGADAAVDALAEYALTDLAALLGEAEPVADEVLELEVPALVAGALEDLELDLPELELELDDDEGQVVGLRLEVTGGPRHVVEVTFSDIGEVTEADVPVPAADAIDATPWIDEEALATLDAVAIVAPPAPPAGFVLGSIFALEPFETPEFCPQVQLEYYEVSDPVDGHLVQVFLLDRRCALEFDPTDFDGTTGGFPSRFGGTEVLVGETVAQIYPTQSVFDVDGFAATFAPTTVEALAATIVPLPS